MKMTKTKQDEPLSKSKKLQNLDDLLVSHFTALLESGKPIKGTTLAVIRDYLRAKPKGEALDDSATVTAFQEEFQTVKLPFDEL